MRIASLLLASIVVFPAAPAIAQVSIDSHGVRSGNVRIDSTGVHSGNTHVTGRGVGVRGGRGDTTINGNDATRTVDCGGGALTVNGNRNRITARECRDITLAGNRNQVRWHREAGRTAVSNVGNGNRVVRF